MAIVGIDTLFNLLVSNTYAADTLISAPKAPSSGGGLPVMGMLALFVVFMYFAVWRPQSKRAKEQRNLLNSLTKGDEVLTAGGILGRIIKLTDAYMVIAIAENTEIVIQKSSVINALPKGTLKSLQ